MIVDAEKIQTTITIKTTGRGLVNITDTINSLINQRSNHYALCNLFIQHTSASIIICENADKTVQDDLERFMQRLIPDGDPLLRHIEEGPDDMPSHIRSVLTQSSITIPIINGAMALGRWQGVYLWEHRLKNHERKITVTFS